MPLAYDQTLISASASSGFHIDVLPDEDHHHHGAPVDLPADPKHAVWALAAAAHHQKKMPQKSSFTTHSHSPHAAPTMSTFSASSLGHIHIVQPYLPNPSSNTQSTNPSDSSSGTPSNGCSTSTFSVHPTSASTPYSFSNPYCTNQLHSLIPGVGASGTAAPGQPPRPANAWILYRSDKMKNIAPPPPGKAKPPQADISKLIAAMWKNEQPEVRQHYEALSDMKKAEHLAQYPGYRFQPMKKADKEKVRAERKAEKEKERLAAAVKSHRRPKSKRATTEETVAFDENEGEPRPELPLQAQVVNPDVASPLSPARTRTFAYKPYAVLSPGPMSPSSLSGGGAPQRRKRTRAKVETPTPALSSEDPSQSEYVPVPQHSVHVTHSFFEHQPHGAPNMDYGYHSPNGLHHGYQMSTPQLSSGSNSDPNSHPTPPYSTVHPGALSISTTTPPPQALSATLESVGGQHDIFQFTDFDAANLLNNPGAEIQVTLPEDFTFDLMDGLGLGLEDSGLGFDSGGGMGFAEFSNMASSGPMEDLTMGFGDYSLADKGNLAVNPQALVYNSSPQDGGLGLQYDANYGNSHRSPPQRLEIATHQVTSDRMSIPPSATSEQFSITSPVDNGSGFYGSFGPQQHYGGMEQYHDQQHQNQRYYPMHAYTSPPQGYMQYNQQGYTSPPHSSFTSPPPQSTMEDGSMSPNGTSRGTRAATTSWQ